MGVSLQTKGASIVKNNFKEKLDGMTWSFSRVNTYKECPYQFYLKYIEKNENGISNFYAELGHFMHEILEGILLGKIALEDAAEYFDEYVDKCVFSEIKKSTGEKAYEACIDYLATTDLEMLDGYDIEGVELKCVYDFRESTHYIGYIDLLLRHKTNGYYVVVDHKSSAYPFRKDGSGVLKSKEGIFQDYKRQAYLYSRYVYEHYGKYPRYIWWNHFKDQKIAKIDFNIDEYNEAMKWFGDTIDQIYQDNDFLPDMSYVKCNVLCDFREECEYHLYED